MVSPHKGELDMESLLKEQVAPEDPAGVKCMLLQLVPSNAFNGTLGHYFM